MPAKKALAPQRAWIESRILGTPRHCLADNFREWRDSLSISQEQMASLLKLSRGYIRNLEQGVQPLGPRGERAIRRYLARLDEPTVESRLSELEERVRVLETRS